MSAKSMDTTIKLMLLALSQVLMVRYVAPLLGLSCEGWPQQLLLSAVFVGILLAMRGYLAAKRKNDRDDEALRALPMALVVAYLLSLAVLSVTPFVKVTITALLLTPVLQLAGLLLILQIAMWLGLE